MNNTHVMAPRAPGRPKASDIQDLTVLQAVLSGSLTPLSSFPSKVRLAKIRKIQAQGLIRTSSSGRLQLTPRGHTRLMELTIK